MSNTQNSSSNVQQDGEGELLPNFVEDNHLTPIKIDFPDNFRIKPDGIYKKPDGTIILAEVYVHQGPLKGSQPDKICADMLKLITAQKILAKKGLKTELYILLACEEAEKHFKGKSWHSAVVQHFDIHVEVDKLRPQTIEKIKQAQEKQKMVNAK